ncbi:MAG TPA: cadherin-like domain-containing protein, partial [Candidatus Dormibacteraeota bacterium]|nr:cadherin-like domain-containing protein [Candidatus Dormibacteraeota bacterium]
DRGDQFFLRAGADSTGVQTFKYGTAVRDFGGAIIYTDRGDLDVGAFDATSKTVRLKVAISKLNAILTAAGHPTLGHGSILAGLRGQAFTNAQGNNVKLDSTRGGTQFRLNRPPVAADDGYSLNEGSTLAVPAPGVLANDSDPDGDPLSAILVSGPAHGSLALTPDGTFVFAPNPGFSGIDGFTYRASDGNDDSGVANVSLTVFPRAGSIPDGGGVPGTPLTISAAGGNLTLTWGSSCRTGDTDYEIYEGTLGAYSSHTQKFCSTSGATTRTFPQPPGSTYYLVVPRNTAREGSYGRASDGTERPQGNNACVPQAIAAACP